MLDAARDVVRMAKGRTRHDLRTDMMLRRAMVNAIQEIGEAACKMSTLGRDRIPSVPWPLVIGMRHRLVHTYDTIDFDVVWQVAVQEAPALIAVLEQAFEAWPLPESSQE